MVGAEVIDLLRGGRLVPAVVHHPLSVVTQYAYLFEADARGVRVGDAIACREPPIPNFADR